MKKTISPICIRWMHAAGFRPGEWAFVTGVVMLEPEGFEARLCYVAMYDDGKTDYIPLSDSANYEIISDFDLKGPTI